MCVIVVKPKGIQIRKEYLKNCYLSNPDGAGFMYVKDDKIVIKKGFFDFALFHWEFEKAERENRKSPFILHFRIATSGGVDLFNCHPFRIDEHNAFVHNGIFYNYSYTKSLLSDTQVFNNRILKELPSGWEKSGGIKRLIASYAKDSSSKLAFLSSDKEIWICGEDEGEWYKKSWYSNSAYMPVRNFGFQQSWKYEKDAYANDYSEYNHNELVYLGKNEAKTSSSALLLDSIVRCVECDCESSVTDVVYMDGFGYICAECLEETKEQGG